MICGSNDYVRSLRNRAKNYSYQKNKIDSFKQDTAYLFDARCFQALSVDVKTHSRLMLDRDFVGLEIKYMENNIKSVEDDFRIIEETCGKFAADIIKENYIEGKTWGSVAYDHDISPRQLYRWLNEWFSEYVKAKENNLIGEGERDAIHE